MDFIYSASHLIWEKKFYYAFSFGSLVVALRIYVGHDLMSDCQSVIILLYYTTCALQCLLQAYWFDYYFCTMQSFPCISKLNLLYIVHNRCQVQEVQFIVLWLSKIKFRNAVFCAFSTGSYSWYPKSEVMNFFFFFFASGIWL